MVFVVSRELRILFTVMIVWKVKTICIPSFVLISGCSVSYALIYVPIIIYGLGLFAVVAAVVVGDIVRAIGFYHFTKFRRSRCPPNGLSEVALFTKVWNISSPSFVWIGCCLS